MPLVAYRLMAREFVRSSRSVHESLKATILVLLLGTLEQIFVKEYVLYYWGRRTTANGGGRACDKVQQHHWASNKSQHCDENP